MREITSVGVAVGEIIYNKGIGYITSTYRQGRDNKCFLGIEKTAI
jgi:hypothetical protein